jgi:hypothetical protein
VSWRTIFQDLDPDPDGVPAFDHEAADIHRLRGLVIAQFAETEAVLERIMATLDPTLDLQNLMAGKLFRLLKKQLPTALKISWQGGLRTISEAIKARNRAVHADVEIGFSWQPYSTGGGEHVPVISLMGGELYDEQDLRNDFGLEQHATEVAVGLLIAVQRAQRPAPGEPS